jgi:REP element-mobilizing transposase RayT
VTLRVRREVPSLRCARFVREFEGTLRALSERGRARVLHYSVQTNHLHLIVEARSGVDLSCGIKAIAARVARAANRVFGRRGSVLDDRTHVRVLKTLREVRHAIAYVLLNSRRHAAKLGRRIDVGGRVDPASSGRWFDGWRRGTAVDRVLLTAMGDPPAVAPARSWLLSVEWRRVGLVDPCEIPGTMR